MKGVSLEPVSWKQTQATGRSLLQSTLASAATRTPESRGSSNGEAGATCVLFCNLHGKDLKPFAIYRKKQPMIYCPYKKVLPS